MGKTKLDPIEKALLECISVCQRHGVVLFRIGVGDRKSFQSFRKKETWQKYCARMSGEKKAKG